MKAKIVVVGSSNTDMILKLDRIPKPGETILGGEFVTAAGGKGANQAAAAARRVAQLRWLRVSAGHVRRTGDRRVYRVGINVDHVQRDKSPFRCALIFVAKDGENSIGVGGGANGELSPADVKKAKAAFATADAVIMQLETPLETVQAAAELAAKGATVILNPAPVETARRAAQEDLDLDAE